MDERPASSDAGLTVVDAQSVRDLQTSGAIYLLSALKAWSLFKQSAFLRRSRTLRG